MIVGVVRKESHVDVEATTTTWPRTSICHVVFSSNTGTMLLSLLTVFIRVPEVDTIFDVGLGAYSDVVPCATGGLKAGILRRADRI